VEVQSEEGTYFYHRVTRAVRWEKPEGCLSEKIEQAAREKEAELKRKQQARKDDMRRAEEEKTAEAAEVARVEAEVQQKVECWSSDRPIAALLASLSRILPTCIIVARGQNLHQQPLLAPEMCMSATQSEIKKAYLKALRLVHPDKVAGQGVSVEHKLLCRFVFIKLTDAYGS
jgi:hypothetical protein